jgi:hypothetical protein
MGKGAEIAGKLWKALRADRTVMLGVADIDQDKVAEVDLAG